MLIVQAAGAGNGPGPASRRHVPVGGEPFRRAKAQSHIGNSHRAPFSNGDRYQCDLYPQKWHASLATNAKLIVTFAQFHIDWQGRTVD